MVPGGIDMRAMFGSPKKDEPQPAPQPEGSGMMEADIGDTVSKFPISQFKGAEKRTDLFGIILGKVFITKTHYDEEFKNRIFCYTQEGEPPAECCKFFGQLPDIRYIIPIVVYDSDGQGNLMPNGKLSIQFLKLDGERYSPFKTMKQQGLDPSRYDYSVECSDAQFQKLTFTRLEAARWRQDSGIERAVLAKLEGLLPYLRPAVASDVPLEVFLKRHGIGAAVPQQTQQGFNLKDLV